MFRSHPVLTVVFLGLIGSLCLVTAGDVTAAATLPAPDMNRQTAVLEQHLVVLDVAGSRGQPTITEAQAVRLAATYLPRSSAATSVQARLATLTLRSEDGGIAWGIQAQPVWLVTFRDVGYPSASGASADCSCLAYFWRPSSVVAVHADSGALVIYLGVEN